MITRTVSQLAEICGATLEGDGERVIVGPASLGEATAEEVSFLGNPLYAQELERTAAGAVVVRTDVRSERRDLALLRCADPNRAFTRVIEVFRPGRGRPEPGIHPTAVVAPDAEVGDGVSVGALSVVGQGAILAPGVVLHPHVVVGPACRIGAGTVIHAGAVLYPEVQIGERCVIHAGAVLGADGFGYDPAPEGWEKVPQCGTVVVEDDVEIGANTTVDRARFGATRICAGAKLDNLVQVAHNVVVGPGAILIAQSGVAGSSRIGSHAMLAGQVGISGHVTIGDGARLAAQSGVTKSLEGNKDYFGSPAREKGEAYRLQALIRRLPEMARRIRELERRLTSSEG